MPTNVSVPADAQRQRRARANYGQNAACKWVRKKAWRACDYTDDGHLRQFDTEEAFLAFEEERGVRGHSQAHYEKKPRDTVPEVQLALAEAITHAVAKDGSAFSSLKWLFLDGSQVGDKGIADLVKALTGGMKAVTRLALQRTKLTNKGLKQLVRVRIEPSHTHAAHIHDRLALSL